MKQPLDQGGFRDVDDGAPIALLAQKLVHLGAVPFAPGARIKPKEPMVPMPGHVAAKRPVPVVTIRWSVFIFAENARWPASVSR